MYKLEGDTSPLGDFTTRPLFPVVARTDGHELLGLIALEDLLRARYLNLDAERRRERVLSIPFGFGRKRVVTNGPDEDESD